MESFVFDRNKWNHLIVCKKRMSSGLFKNVIYKMCEEIMYLTYMFFCRIAYIYIYIYMFIWNNLVLL